MIKHKIKSWPYECRIVIREVNLDTETSEVHIFEHWCHLESVDNDADLSASLFTRYHKKFDIDFYRLIQKSLNEHQDILFLKAA